MATFEQLLFLVGDTIGMSLSIVNTISYNSKNKSQNLYSIRFSTMRIFHVQMATSEGEGGMATPTPLSNVVKLILWSRKMRNVLKRMQE